MTFAEWRNPRKRYFLHFDRAGTLLADGNLKLSCCCANFVLLRAITLSGGNIIKRRNHRDLILEESVHLYNASGTVAVTTNHIARHLKISPGNLYFHFANKEEIIRELFRKMADEIYSAWNPRTHVVPNELIEKSFEIFWTYRFFHREMYHLRRMDPHLAKLWRTHLKKCDRLLKLNYGRWVKAGAIRPIKDPSETKMLSDLLLVSSSAYLSFFESPEKPASKKVLRDGVDHVARLLDRYLV